MIEWQPKFARDASALAASVPDDGLNLTGLVGALERVLSSGTPRSYRVAEFTQAADPGQTAAADYLRRAPEGAPAAVDLGCGLLRACAYDLVVIDARKTALTTASWALLRRLLLPGGLALVRHPDPGFAHPGPGWSKVGRGPHVALWTAPPGLFDDGAAELDGPRWVIAGDGPPR